MIKFKVFNNNRYKIISSKCYTGLYIIIIVIKHIYNIIFTKTIHIKCKSNNNLVRGSRKIVFLEKWEAGNYNINSSIIEFIYFSLQWRNTWVNYKTIYVQNIIKHIFSSISRTLLTTSLPVGALGTMISGSFHGEVIELGTQLIHIYM